MDKSRISKALRLIGCLAFWLLVWYLLSLAVNRVLVLPTPLAVLKRLCVLMGSREFYISCLWSVLRIFAGLSLGVILGILLSSLCVVSKTADALISPIISVIKATPVASVIILMLYVLGKGAVPMIASLLMVIPVVFMNVRRGIEAVPVGEKEVAAIYGFGFGKRLKYCILPSVLPYFNAACRSALGLSWKAGIAAEVICNPQNAIGGKLYEAKIYLETEELYAWTVVVILLSFLIEKGIVILLDRFTRKGGAAVVTA